MRTPVVAASLVVVLASSVSARAEIYRWVDEHGVTHLDDTLDNVPEGSRPDAKVFQSRTPVAAPANTSGPTQAAFANGVARELGLVLTDTQDVVSALHIVGIYPNVGWNPGAPLTAAVVDEVARSARAAARGRRLQQSEGTTEAAVLRVASTLGIAGPPPQVVEPAPAPAPPTVVVAPNIVVEAPPANVVVHTIERERAPVLTRYGWDPAFGGGVPFHPIPSGRPGPIPDRITPLSSPAGRLHGPAVPPRPGLQPFRRPPTF